MSTSCVFNRTRFVAFFLSSSCCLARFSAVTSSTFVAWVDEAPGSRRRSEPKDESCSMVRSERDGSGRSGWGEGGVAWRVRGGTKTGESEEDDE